MTTPKALAPNESPQTEPQGSCSKTQNWQAALRPLMTQMIIGLTFFFFIASLAQLIYLQWKIGLLSESRIDNLSPILTADFPEPTTVPLSIAKFKASVLLEAKALEYRHKRADVFLMARVWTRYLGFITGMILAFVGATFVLGKLQESQSYMEAKASGIALSLKTASPGIILAFLGTMMMLTTIVIHHPIAVNDVSVYMTPIYNNYEGTEPAREVIEIKRPTLNPREERSEE